MIAVKPGQRLRSAVCTAEVMIIKGTGEIDITCGGAPMVGSGEDADATAAPGQMEGCLMGKRYVNSDQSLELLCINAGKGSLASGGVPLAIKQAKKLPSSD